MQGKQTDFPISAKGDFGNTELVPQRWISRNIASFYFANKNELSPEVQKMELEKRVYSTGVELQKLDCVVVGKQEDQGIAIKQR